MAPGGVVPLGVDAVVAAVLAVALPGDDEVAGGVHGHGGHGLAVGRVGVDLELAALGDPGGVVPLGVDAVVAAVLVAVAGPGDDEVAGGVHGHRRGELLAGPEGVDLELAALGDAVVVVPLGVDAVAAAVLTV